jgi:hypothetical protein
MPVLLSSVVVGTADALAMTGGKPEHDPILFVHSNTVKAGKIASELLQPIRGRSPQILDACTGIQQIELSLHPGPDFPRQVAGSFGVAAVIDVGRRGVAEADDYFLIIPYYRVTVYT